MAKRGFFAELNYQAQVAEREKQKKLAAANRAQAAAEREQARIQREVERAQAASQRASLAEQKAADKDLARLHVEARLAEVETLNAKLASDYSEIDALLEWTLGIDDFVDLESLRQPLPTFPPLDAGHLAQPLPQMPELVYPPQPVWQEPALPSGLGAAMGGKKRHEEKVAQARLDFQEAQTAWHQEATRMHAEYVARLAQREESEAARLKALAEAQMQYEASCAAHLKSIGENNAQLDRLINDLAFDVAEAIRDYVGIVLANSAYPESFPVVHEYEFDLESRELALIVVVPAPSSVPTIKAYKYARASDEITSTNLPVGEQRERYSNAVWQVAVRTLHEVFEADRAGRIYSISLQVVSNQVSPATGLPESIPFVVVAADRPTFTNFDLANAVPHATLVHLGASLSKNPFALTPADSSRGVRARGV